MISFYSILFSIKVKVDNQASDFFSIEPTTDGKRKLEKLGLMFKPADAGCLVLIEKIGEEESSAESLRKILEPTDFVFFLHLKKPDLLRNIRPFKRSTTQSYPPFIGRLRKLYFNNLSATNVIEDSRPDLTDIDGQAGDGDLGSITPNKFGHAFSNPSVRQIVVRELRPSGVILPPFDVSGGNKTVQFELENGAYQLEQRNGVISSEIIFAQTELLQTNAIGIIQIFKDASIQYNVPVNYEIQFTTL